MVVTREAAPVSVLALQEAGNIANGADVILRAIAIGVVDGAIDWEDPAGAAFIRARFEEIATAVQVHWATVGRTVVGCHTAATQKYRDEILHRGRSAFLAQFALLGDLAAHVTEVRKAHEHLGDIPLVVVAGHQASGKDSLAPVFSELGFFPLTMSDFVRNAASVWELNRDGTEDKIVTGRVLKDYFGDGILVKLGAMEGVLSGAKRLVMFGPRVMGEIDEALHMGGTLIGVRAHEDPEIDREIRRARVAHRATIDPSRVGDIVRFDEREEIEAQKIDQMLRHPQCRLFVDNSPLGEFRRRFSEFVAPLLTRND